MITARAFNSPAAPRGLDVCLVGRSRFRKFVGLPDTGSIPSIGRNELILITLTFLTLGFRPLLARVFLGGAAFEDPGDDPVDTPSCAVAGARRMILTPLCRL